MDRILLKYGWDIATNMVDYLHGIHIRRSNRQSNYCILCLFMSFNFRKYRKDSYAKNQPKGAHNTAGKPILYLFK